MTYALHAVEVKNNIDIEKAKMIAQEFIKDKKKKMYKESKNFFRFRNIPKQKFKPRSFKSKKINEDIILVYGILKPENNHLSGSGFMDFIKNPIGHIKEAFAGTPTKLNNTATKTLNEYGNLPINALQIARTPLNNMLEGAINAVSLGKFSELKNKYGFDKLYHLSLIATLSTNKIIIEKNEVITIEPLSQSGSIKSNTEYYNIPLNNPNLNLNTLIENTKNLMGESKFYDYDSFTNNCQNFIESVLKANNLYNQQAGNFLMQNVSGIQQDLNSSGFSYVPKVMRKITNMGSIFSRLMGKGTKKDALDAFEKYVEKNKLTESEMNNLTEHFIDFINSEGFRFL